MTAPDSARGSQAGGQQLSDLNGVQRRALAEIVPGDEQRQATTIGHPRVAPDAADERHVGAGGSVCMHCRPSGSVTPPQAVLDLMVALHEGDWPVAESSTASHRSHASGLVAAHLQWHLERQLRTLPLVERIYSQPANHEADMVRQDVAHGEGPGDQLLAQG